MSFADAEAIAEARALAQNLAQNLPGSISAASLGVRSKTPYKALTIREALIWRMEELGRVTCDLMEKNDIVAAALLARSALEGAAMMWELRRVIERRVNFKAEEIDRRIHALLVGQRREAEQVQMPNILGLIDKLDQRIEGTREKYNTLSEYAHPNWSGVAGAYSRIDRENFKTEFGKNSLMVYNTKMIAAAVLSNSLMLFALDYDTISDMMPVWLSELDIL